MSQDTESYGTTASVNFQIASMLKDIDRDEAEKYYREGVRYLAAYGYHKDVSIERILDSYPVYSKVDPEGAKNCRWEITTMTIALLNHTDGRITNHYLNRWFRTLLRTDLKYALSFLKGYQQEVKEGWILERMILDAAEKLSETGEYDGYAIKFLESLPNNVSNELLQISVNILNRLMVTDRMGAEKFYINILSRFHFVGNSHSFYERNLDQECVGCLMGIGDDLGLPITHYKKYFADIKQEENRFPNTYDGREVFMCESLSEAKDWFGKHFLRKDIYEDVTAFLLKMPGQSDEMAEIYFNL